MRIKIVSIIVISIVSALLLAFSMQGVHMKGTIDPYAGGIDCPIHVEVNNYTFKEIRNIFFGMELFKDNKSINLFHTGKHGSYNFDAVIKPFSSESGCFSDKYISATLGISEDMEVLGALTSSEYRQLAEKLSGFSKNHAIYVNNINPIHFK